MLCGLPTQAGAADARPHGIEAKLGEQPADTFLRNQNPDLKADFGLPNPPFNVSDWSGQFLRSDKRVEAMDFVP